MPIKVAIEYIRLILSNPEMVACIKAKMDAIDGIIDDSDIPEEKSYGDIVFGFSEWFLWKKKLKISRASWQQQLERCVYAFSDVPAAEITDQQIVSWMREYKPPPSPIYARLGRERPEEFDYSEMPEA